MSNASGRRRHSLKDRISGPNAVPIATLVAQGDVASRQVRETFEDFLKLRVGTLEGMRGQLSLETSRADVWKGFYAIVHDIRGSSALAGKWSVSAVCLSLEKLLRERDESDPRMDIAIASHTGALNLIISGGIMDEKTQSLLTEELARAVDYLPLKQPELVP